MTDVNLRAMCTIREAFRVDVGYSDHTLGIDIPIAAVALGARIIEKHLTLDRNQAGPDHAASLEPNEFADMVQGVRNIEQALGDGIKRPSNSEMKNIGIARKSVTAKVPIKAGDVFTSDNLAVKRPGTGISPMLWDGIIGRRAPKDFAEDAIIEL
jgi:N,N'-diacetyllegionaminate synthase